jgi:lincosamide nucleotidyltransferase A/C/D/E
MISADDVLTIDDTLTSAGIEYWIGGWWGVDALLGRQTRDHADMAALQAAGLIGQWPAT